MRHKRFLFLFLTGLLITFGLVYWVGFREVWRDLTQIRLDYFLVLLAIQIVMMLLWALKWSIVLRHTKASFRKILPISFVGYLANNLIPFAMAAGEPTRAYLLSRFDDISTEDSAASVIVDLFLEVFPLMLMILLGIGLALFYDVGHGVAIFLMLAGVFVLFILGIILLLFVNKRVSLKVIETTINLVEKIPVKFLREHAKDAKTRVDDIIENFMTSMHKTMTDKTILISGITISIITWALWILRMHLIFQMLGYNLPLDVLIIGRITVSAAAFPSIIPGGMGIWEGVGTWIYTVFGIPAPTALAANLIERLYSLWIGSLIGLAATAYLGATHYIENYLN